MLGRILAYFANAFQKLGIEARIKNGAPLGALRPLTNPAVFRRGFVFVNGAIGWRLLNLRGGRLGCQGEGYFLDILSGGG